MKMTTPEARKIYLEISNKLINDEKVPTIKELGNMLNLSTRKILDGLRELEDKLIIKRSPYKSRAIEIITPLNQDHEQKISVPILGTAPGGPFLFASENIEDQIEIPRRLLKGFENVFLLRVIGNSMSPFLEDGDLALVKQQSNAESRDIVVAVRNDGTDGYEATIKEYYKTDSQIILSPLNKKEYLPITGSLNEISIQGKVVGAIKFSFNNSIRT